MNIFKIAAILSLVLLSNLANAHAKLKHSFPEYGAMLNKPPEDLILEFSAQVKLAKLQLTDQSGKLIKLNSEPSKKFQTTFHVVLPMLDTGSYKVKWMAMAKDAHKMKEDFPFTVQASAMEKMPASSDE